MDKDNEAMVIDIRPFVWPVTSIIISIIFSFTIIVSTNAFAGAISGSGVTIKRDVKGDSVAAPSDTGTVEVNDAGETVVTTSIDDDAVLGDLGSAKVVIVEFSDYECPFCQRFWSDALVDIKQNYISTGDVALVFRDLPLSFHEPMASKAANLAECARDQGGDDAYFKVHDIWFENTPANGEGMQDDKIKSLLSSAGLSAQKIIDCANADTYNDEIQADASAAASVGIGGTPGFVVGVLNDDGTVTGEIISGAYPFDEFDRVIKKYL